MKKVLIPVFILFLFNSFVFGQRIKDIGYFTGDNTGQIIGYGLVVGLAGTGDSYRTPFTPQSVMSMLKRFGITVSQSDLKTKNVAAVMVTASISSYLKTGAKFDVNVSSLGDATSLQGGTLLITPLSSLGGKTYGMAQGSVSVGGFDISTASGARTAQNHTLAGRIPRGGSLIESLVETSNVPLQEISLFLRDPDMTTANNVTTAINTKFGANTAKSQDAAEIKIKVPQDRQKDIVPFLSELEVLPITADYRAKVVLNERTGTVVAGSNVKIYPVTISQGNLNITIKSYPIVAQPGAFSNGTAQIYNNLVPYVVQDSAHIIGIQGASNVQEVTAALNSLKVSPRDIISIFQALKEAGALVAELIIL